MKKYYMAFVDFSEIINVTADTEQLEKAKVRMAELELLTEKGNPSTTQLRALAEQTSGAFLDKLQKRVARRPGGITAVRDTFQKLFDKKEYHAMFLYLVFLYGFIEWQVPERTALLPASSEALKIFMTEFMTGFYKRLQKEESEDIAEDDKTEEDM